MSKESHESNMIQIEKRISFLLLEVEQIYSQIMKILTINKKSLPVLKDKREAYPKKVKKT